MAKFITTSGTSYYLEQLITNASSQLVLVTPFLRLNQNFIERLRDADSSGIHIILIYGKSRLKQNEWYMISELKNIDIYFCENLHAKCYQNDDALIISSMNLYEYSQQNNREMSILIEKDSDNDIYEDASEEIQSIINASIIKKTSGRMEKGMQDISLDPDYNDMDNFHIPFLLTLLEDTYPKTSFSIEKDSLNDTDQIVSKNFPVEGIDLQIDDRIFFLLSAQNHVANWYESSSDFYDSVSEAKIFLDQNKLKFYWKDRTKVPASEETLPIKANSYLNIVKKVVAVLE